MRIRKDLIELYKPTNGTEEFTGFILVTSDNYVGIREKAIEAGFDGFVPTTRGDDAGPGDEIPYVLIAEEINFPDVLPVNNGALNLQYVVPRTAAFYLRFRSEYSLPSGNVTFDLTVDGTSVVSETVPIIEGSSGIITLETIVVLEKDQVLDIAVSGLSEEGTSMTSNVLVFEETTERSPLVFNSDFVAVAGVDPLADGVLGQITAIQDGPHVVDVALPVFSEGSSFTVKLMNGTALIYERSVSATETFSGELFRFNTEVMFATGDVLTLTIENFDDGTAWINQFPNAPTLASTGVLKILPGTDEMVVVLGTEDNAEVYAVDADYNWTKFGDNTSDWYIDSISLANLGGGKLYSGNTELSAFIVDTTSGVGVDISTESGPITGIRDYMVADNVAYVRGTFGGLWERTSAGVWTDIEAEPDFPAIPVASMFFANDWLYLFTPDVSMSKRRNIDGIWELWTTTADNFSYRFPQHFEGKMYAWDFDENTGNIMPTEFDPLTGASTVIDPTGGPGVLSMTEPAVWHGSLLYGATWVENYNPSTDGPVDPNTQPRMYYRRLEAGTASTQEGALVTVAPEAVIPDRYQHVYESTEILTNEVVFDNIVLPETAETHIFYQMPYNLVDQTAEVKVLVNGTVIHTEGIDVNWSELDILTFAVVVDINRNDVLSVEHAGFVDTPEERIYDTILTITQLTEGGGTGAVGDLEAEYDPTISVPRGALVRHLGKFYRCIRDYPGTDLDLSKSTYFQVLSVGKAYVTPFSVMTEYEAGDIILLDKNLYFAKEATKGSFIVSNWIKMETGTLHDDLTRYSDGTIGIVRGTCINVLDDPNAAIGKPVFYTNI